MPCEPQQGMDHSREKSLTPCQTNELSAILRLEFDTVIQNFFALLCRIDYRRSDNQIVISFSRVANSLYGKGLPQDWRPVRSWEKMRIEKIY
jgi:hypothetical protein